MDIDIYMLNSPQWRVRGLPTRFEPQIFSSKDIGVACARTRMCNYKKIWQFHKQNYGNAPDKYIFFEFYDIKQILSKIIYS